MKFKVWGIPFKFILVDVLIIVAAFYLSLFLRLDAYGLSEYSSIVIRFLPIVIGIQIAILILSQNYKAIWRYFTAHDTVKLAKAVFSGSLILMAISFLIPPFSNHPFFSEFIPERPLPRSIFLIYPFVLTILLLNARLLVRFFYESKTKKILRKNRIRILIYGAGKNGQLLAQRYLSEPNSIYEVVGFIDEKKEHHGRTIGGVNILGGRSELPKIISHYEVQQVIISISQIDSEVLKELVLMLNPFNIKPKIVHSTNLFDFNNSVEIIRDINTEDLLRRSQRYLNLDAIRDIIEGKVVLVTGAGGSIGSELVKQIHSFKPAKLINLDHSEYALYKIDSEIRLSNEEQGNVVPILADLKDTTTVNSILNLYKPEIVFHAAAYKHVHLVESNPYSAIINNIFGTKNLIEASLNNDVKNFVLISTDKAVNPVGIMGATKRICELLVTKAAIQSGKNYSSVRFGNVLGSSGSLIPKLQEQISNGGPVTITHEKMTRYFMLIQEAVSLVLQSASLSKPGDINILKMGDPVEILELAKTLIVLSGKKIGEIPIIFTGLRPGEKMYEELYIRGDELQTEHPDVLTLPLGDVSQPWSHSEILTIESLINRIIVLAQESNSQSIVEMKNLIKRVLMAENVTSILQANNKSHMVSLH